MGGSTPQPQGVWMGAAYARPTTPAAAATTTERFAEAGATARVGVVGEDLSIRLTGLTGQTCKDAFEESDADAVTFDSAAGGACTLYRGAGVQLRATPRCPASGAAPPCVSALRRGIAAVATRPVETGTTVTYDAAGSRLTTTTYSDGSKVIIERTKPNSPTAWTEFRIEVKPDGTATRTTVRTAGRPLNQKNVCATTPLVAGGCPVACQRAFGVGVVANGDNKVRLDAPGNGGVCSCLAPPGCTLPGGFTQ